MVGLSVGDTAGVVVAKIIVGCLVSVTCVVTRVHVLNKLSTRSDGSCFTIDGAVDVLVLNIPFRVCLLVRSRACDVVPKKVESKSEDNKTLILLN